MRKVNDRSRKDRKIKQASKKKNETKKWKGRKSIDKRLIQSTEAQKRRRIFECPAKENLKEKQKEILTKRKVKTYHVRKETDRINVSRTKGSQSKALIGWIKEEDWKAFQKSDEKRSGLVGYGIRKNHQREWITYEEYRKGIEALGFKATIEDYSIWRKGRFGDQTTNRKAELVITVRTQQRSRERFGRMGAIENRRTKESQELSKLSNEGTK